MLSDAEGLRVINGFKADLTRFASSVARAVADGRVNAVESIGLIAQGSQLGLGYYYEFARLQNDLDDLVKLLERVEFTLDS